jgi:pimeloyl-ACP methyl ester carboxylesterase
VPSFAITRDGVRVAYEQSGRGPPLVLVHGLGDDRALWQPLIERFSSHFRCFALDLRGHGQTTGAVDFDLFGLHRDLEAVVIDGGVQKPLLVGHSLGALVASTYAATYGGKVRAVINVDQPLALSELAQALAAQAESLRAGLTEHVLMAVLDQLGLGPLEPALRGRLAQTRKQLAHEVVLGVWGPLLEADVVTVQQLRLDALLARIVAPYLCLLGRDTEPHAGWLHARVPHAEFESWRDLGHFLHLVEPERFVDRVLAFTASC